VRVPEGAPLHRTLGDAHSLTSALRDLEESPLRHARAQEIRHLLAELESHRAELERQNQQLRESRAQLEQSHARYADLYDFAPVAYLRLNPAADILEANLTAASLFRAERGKLIGRPLGALVTPASRPILLAHVRACFGEATQVTNEIEIRRRNGPHLAVQITSTPLLGPDGVVAAKTTLTDVSELKRAQDVLRFLAEASATLASSFDYRGTVSDTIRHAVPLLGDVAFVDVFDRAGDLRRIGVAVAAPRLNRLARNARDAHPTQGRGTPVEWVLQTRQPLLMAECKASTFREGTGEFAHEPFVRACAPRSLMYLPIVTRGNVFGVLTFLAIDPGRQFGAADLGSAADLANRIALAIENARLFEDATRAIKSRDQVMSFVSHDLKNPLMGILLSTELLLNRAPAEERRSGWKQLDRIRRGVQQMRHMVEDLLDASSIDSGRLAIDVGEHRASGVFEEALELLRPIAQDRGIELKTDLRAAELDLVCDRHRLIQVLYNLIGNAIKFTPRAGQVRVGTERAGQELLVTVEDSGPGIPPELMPHLFQRYAQAETAARQGRGLGLFISRGIVQAHGGRIWADPAARSGAKLQFTLPLCVAGRGGSSSIEPSA
jgi:PAS domain S-box-containing protein